MHKKEIDLIIHNAQIFSVSKVGVKYDAMAINNGQIIDLGKENQILNKNYCKNSIDLKSAFVYPGFIDAHCHFLNYGLIQQSLYVLYLLYCFWTR